MKRCAIAAPWVAALLVAGAAWGQDAKPTGSAANASTGGFAIPVSRPAQVSATAEPLPPPKRFTTRHTIRIGRQRIAYTAIAGETYLYNRAAEPIGSIFSFTYLREGPVDPKRAVLFVFNGGPGSASTWLHMGAVGPRRVVLDREVDPSNVPPFGLADNPYSVLDVADLVFIDPVGTGFSRVIGKGTTADFWGVDEDADSVAQFIELWLTEHGRWNSPKFLMGESYGSVRAAVLPRALMGGPLYVGTMRGITVNGVVLLGTVLNRPGAAPADPELRQALALVSPADTAWYHQRIDRAGRSIEAFHQEVLGFAKSDYAAALRAEKAGTLTAETRRSIVARLTAFTGLPASAFEKSIAVRPDAFSRQLLADRGLQVGMYDGRYTLPLEGGDGDPVADDPAMGRYVPGFIAAFHEMLTKDLGVRMERPYGSIVWKDLLLAWNWQRNLPRPDDYAHDLGVAMRRNPALRVMVASGYYDLGSQSSHAENAVEQAGWPADRYTLRRYPSGHMLYIGDTAEAFANDVRELIRRASP